MLDHFERQHDIKACTGLGQRFGGGVAIVDCQTRLSGMAACRGDRLGVCVDSRHGKAQARHRLGDQAAATTDIEQAEPLEWP